jgi:hypothetical protein
VDLDHAKERVHPNEENWKDRPMFKRLKAKISFNIVKQ